MIITIYIFKKKRDEKEIRSLFGINKGRIAMREALGMTVETPAKEAIQKFWLLGEFLDLGTGVKNKKLGNDLKKENVQDPYSFRCIPQVHGATQDTLNYCINIISTEINSVTDNPLIFLDDRKIISGGNFHGQPLAYAIDFLKISMSELGNISERRVF